MEFNPGFVGYNNSIKNYNKVFNNDVNALNINLGKDGMFDFDNVLQNQVMQRNSMPQGPIINTGIQMNIGLENMGVAPLTPIDRMDMASTANNDKRKHPMSAVEKTANDFASALGNGLNSVNNAQNEAYDAAEIFAAGGDISVHDVMIASQKANLTMQMAVQLRNRLVNAYTEINNVRV